MRDIAYAPEEDLDTDEIAARLQHRLEQRDAEDEDAPRSYQSPADKDYARNVKRMDDFRHREDERKQADEKERRNTIEQKYIAAAQKAGKRLALDPPMPPADEDHGKRAVEWHQTPLRDRQIIAHSARTVEQALKAGAEMGYKVDPKDPIAVRKFMDLMYGGAGQQQQTGGDPADYAAAERTVTNVVEPLLAQAQQMGISPEQLPQMLQQYTAADRSLDANPVGSINYLVKHYGINPQSLSDPDWAEFDRQCRASGTDSKSAVGNLIAAENWLEQSPAEAMSWLADRYELSYAQLMSIAQKRRRAA